MEKIQNNLEIEFSFKEELQENVDKMYLTGRAVNLGEISRNRNSYESGFIAPGTYEVPALYNHSTENVIGSTKYLVSENYIDFEMKLNPDLPKAMEVWSMVKNENVKHVSISVYPNEYNYIQSSESKDGKGYYAITQGELLELSIVPVPGFNDAKINTYESLEETPKVEKQLKKEYKYKRSSMNKIETVSQANEAIKNCDDLIQANEALVNAKKGTLKTKKEEFTTEETQEMMLEIETLENEITKEKLNKESVLRIKKDILEAQERIIQNSTNETFVSEGMSGEALEESVWLANIQKHGFSEANDQGGVTPLTLLNDIIADIETAGKLTGLTTKVSNAQNLEYIPFADLLENIHVGMYGSPENDVDGGYTTSKKMLALATFAHFIPITENERRMTLPAFRTWLIKNIVDVVVTQIDNAIISGNLHDAGINEDYGIQGVASTWSLDNGLTTKYKLKADTAVTVEDIIQASALIKSSAKQTLVIHPVIWAEMQIDALSNAGNAAFIQTILNSYNLVLKHEMPSALTEVTATKPAFALGVFSEFELRYATSAMVQVGQTPKDKHRTNTIHVHADIKGSAMKKEQFVCGWTTATLPAGGLLVEGASVQTKAKK